MASNSRRTVVKSLLGLAALAATGALAARRTIVREPERSGSRVPLLIWNEGAAAAPAENASSLARALWLVLGSVSAQVRAAVFSDLAELLDASEARHLPLGLDLSDDPPSLIAQRLRKTLLPAWTTARSLVRGAWSASDGSLSVRVATRDEPSTQGITSAAWSEPSRNTLADRARFLAWPVSHAVLVDAGSEAHAAALTALLRPDVTRESALIGLVVDAAVQRVTPLVDAEPQRKELEQRLRRLSPAALGTLGDAEALARALREGLPQARVPPWLDLNPSELLIVPRLSSLARRPRFLAELDQAARRVSANARRISS